MKGPGARKALAWLVLFLAAWSWQALAQKPGTGGKQDADLERSAREWTVRVERKDSMAGRTQTATRNSGIKKAKERAVRDYIELSVPDKLRAENKEAIEEIAKLQEELVLSIETLSERVEGAYLIMELEVTLDRVRLDTLLRSRGLLPARDLPLSLVVMRIKDRGSVLRSAWDSPPGDGRSYNPAESRMAAVLSGYGFKVIDPSQSSGTMEVDSVISPGDPRAIKSLMGRLRRDYSAGALFVGLVSLEEVGGSDGDAGSGGMVEVVVMIAACDLVKREVVFTDRIRDRVKAEGALARAQAVRDACDKAGERAVEAMFSSYAEKKYQPGEEREITLRVQGIGSYSAMQSIMTRVGEEAPGVKGVSLTRMSPAEIEYKVRLVVDSKALAEWLAQNKIEGVSFEIVSVNQSAVTVLATQ